MDMSAIVGFGAGEEGRALSWLLCLLPNSFLKRTAFPYHRKKSPVPKLGRNFGFSW